MRCGFTEAEILQTVARLREGKSYQEAIDHVLGVVEPEVIRARREEICARAGVDPAAVGEVVSMQQRSAVWEPPNEPERVRVLRAL